MQPSADSAGIGFADKEGGPVSDIVSGGGGLHEQARVCRLPLASRRHWLLTVSFGNLRLTALLLFALLSLPAIGAPRQVIIDTDPGTDDALAIMLALNSPELVVRALTVVAGNVPAPMGLDNALRLVSLARRCDIPVAAGNPGPLVRTLTTGEFWHGANGLGNVVTAPATCAPDHRWAPDLIIQMVHAAPHELTLVTIGPLTNIALAIQKDPSIVPLVKEVIMMGGSLSGGNTTSAAEFNVYVDPEAAQIVLQAGWPITMVGLDVCDKTLLTRVQLVRLAHEERPLGRFVYQVGSFLVGAAEASGAAGASMYDPLAVGAAIDPSLLTTRAMRVDVETTGILTRGETVANRSGMAERRELRSFPEGERSVVTGYEPVTPNVHVAIAAEADRFVSLLLSRTNGK
jgi:purine nucleosidase